MEMSSQIHAPIALPSRKNPGTHWIGGWVDTRDGLDVLDNRQISYPYRNLKPEPPGPKSSHYTD
jgi:hypothetical protein